MQKNQKIYCQWTLAKAIESEDINFPFILQFAKLSRSP